MPKKVITEETLPRALHLLDQWQGKLRWDEYAKRVGDALGVNVTKGALQKHQAIQDAFSDRQDALRKQAKDAATTGDVTLDFLKDENQALQAKVERLEKKIALYKEQFVRWQSNLYMMPNVDMEELNSKIDKPLTNLKRSS